MDPKARKKLEGLVYKHTHPDFKGRWADGTKSVLHFVTGIGTCSVPISSLTDGELYDKLPKKVRDTLELSLGK